MEVEHVDPNCLQDDFIVVYSIVIFLVVQEVF